MADTCQEEILELIWTMEEENDKVDKDVLLKKVDLPDAERHIKALVEESYIIITNKKVQLTKKGRVDARLIIRRHRLAERLLHDVLEVKEDTMDSSACKFEHFLDEEVTASICTLLGHPVSCPHGKAIPPGDCCEKANKEIRPVVMPLTELRSGDEARISYIVTKYHQRLDKLSSMGLVPGVQIRLHQRQPTYVIQMGETQIALDSAIAQSIYVRLI
ncbi:MAG: transcriptional regulator [Candidatus Jettenia sp.]|uniref:Putative iron dependent repressor n=1 Tax=Candidatus Jettenia caeni TaxID=247490 RepID=I3IN51_9BACT|nr:metal-dependent transcriptional regulator [Candidatus Jettenia sp. AMX1]MBC6928030.1 transcriptional regulator [Candidatus Jettenia sp.]NUN24063.1 metal-dependent transcriptional regulator [Candidatus Jettenia caeni]KAA0251130.1 MAG: transcriptional regulator [Candidatus Jettenia sp. AMX1]MCE7879331.1 transcriptional regulator [Candidatus Jettenia sp. AMX1]MCQ3927445.1 transcriptional regulator [Candidatus Jettenia sp.]